MTVDSIGQLCKEVKRNTTGTRKKQDRKSLQNDRFDFSMSIIVRVVLVGRSCTACCLCDASIGWKMDERSVSVGSTRVANDGGTQHCEASRIQCDGMQISFGAWAEMPEKRESLRMPSSVGKRPADPAAPLTLSSAELQGVHCWTGLGGCKLKEGVRWG